jgi:putative FmdB family regulatory protein
MPTYVYGCDACGHQFERFQKFSDEPVRVCPECGNTVRRIFQPAGIVFKGSGWHVTDYKRSSNGSTNGENGEVKKDTASESKNEKGAKSETSETKSSANTTSESAAP